MGEESRARETSATTLEALLGPPVSAGPGEVEDKEPAQRHRREEVGQDEGGGDLGNPPLQGTVLARFGSNLGATS